MAFDGPSPFDGDPVFNYLDEVEGADAEGVRNALEEAFDFILGDEEYYEIDETVWAWAAAELVAIALGRPASPPPPPPFDVGAQQLSQSDGETLRSKAIAALNVIVDPTKSEAADLWNERGEGTLGDHIADLCARLAP